MNLFEPVTTNLPNPGYIQPLRPAIKVDEKIKYEVFVKVNSRLFERAKKLQYCIRWTGYGKFNWEFTKNITYTGNLLHNFILTIYANYGPYCSLV